MRSKGDPMTHCPEEEDALRGRKACQARRQIAGGSFRVIRSCREADGKAHYVSIRGVCSHQSEGREFWNLKLQGLLKVSGYFIFYRAICIYRASQETQW